MSVDQSLQLALQYHRGGQLELARAIYCQILAHFPFHPEALHLLGVLSAQSGHPHIAVELIGKAVSVRPHDAEFHANLANALRENGQIEQAMAACRHALELNNDFPDAHNNLGAMLEQQRRFGEAMAEYDKAIGLNPQFARAHVNKAVLLLLQSDFANGWREYEWRLKSDDRHSFGPPSGAPRWDGGDLDGRTLLLHAEQGFGDTLQFIRYAPLLAARKGRVIVSCQPELCRLLQCLADASLQIVPAGNLPKADVHDQLMSLALRFGTRLETVPAPAPHLSAPTDLVQSWEKKLAAFAGRLKVGLVWSGRSSPKKRPIPFRDLARLAKIPGITFFSLQKGPAAAEAAGSGMESVLIDLTADLHDFTDTAAMIANLDLIISVDTATAHLAGAMGKPVWLLLPFCADWRWLLDRDDSPWYPTMRLFRQDAPGAWPEVVGKVAEALGRILQESGVRGDSAKM